MTAPRVGIWLIGTRGGVAATATVGLIGLQKQLTRTVGLVSELPYFTGVDFAPWPSFVIGGHEIREGTLVEAVERLRTDSHVFDSALVDACRDELAAIDARIRPGTLNRCGDTIGRLAGPSMRDFADESAQQAVKRLQNDLREFQQ